MTPISNLSALSPSSNTQKDFAKASLDYDSFLKLLLQQLKSQDPTSPVDQKETLAQLASFSNVEQTIKLNQKLDTLLGQQRLVEATSMIGKHVQSLTSGEQGIVQAVEVLQGQTFALLSSGSKLQLSSDIRISE